MTAPSAPGPGGSREPGDAPAGREEGAPRRGRLEGKVALVTGGGSGIGRGIALLFATEGAAVVLAGRRSEPLQETVREIRRVGGAATFARGDVTKADRAEMIVQSATYNFGGLDIVVNAAGIFLPGDLAALDERRFDRILATNLKAPYLVARCAAPALRLRGGGSILNIAALDALKGRRDAAAYAASKGGLVAMTRSLALDLAPHRIRVNALCPGTVDTPLTRDAASGGGPSFLEAAAAAIPLGRPGRPEDVAHAALWLVSDEGAWVTGVAVPVDGGALAT